MESVETDLPVVSKPELSMRSSFEVLSIGLDDEDEVRQPPPSRSCRDELQPWPVSSSTFRLFLFSNLCLMQDLSPRKFAPLQPVKEEEPERKTAATRMVSLRSVWLAARKRCANDNNCYLRHS